MPMEEYFRGRGYARAVLSFWPIQILSAYTAVLPQEQKVAFGDAVQANTDGLA